MTHQSMPATADARRLQAAPINALISTLVLALIVAMAPGVISKGTPASAAASTAAIFISDAELASMPTSGRGWTFLMSRATKDPGTPNLSNQDSFVQTNALAAAIAWKRNGSGIGRAALVDKLKALPGTEKATAQSLNVFRQVATWVAVADLIDYDGATVSNNGKTWDTWLRGLADQQLNTPQAHWDTIRKCAMVCGHNWGTYARASLTAIAAWFGDQATLADMNRAHRRWAGDTAYTHLYTPTKYALAAKLSMAPFTATAQSQGVINRVVAGDRRSSVNIEDGARQLSNGMPTGSGLTYQMGALDGALATAVILWHNGYKTVLDAGMDVGGPGLKRNAVYLGANWYKFEGVYRHTPWFTDYLYGTSLRQSAESSVGRALGYGEWFSSGRWMR